MAQQFTIEVGTREATGTRAAGRLRRIDDFVPGIVYGAGLDNVMITVPNRVLLKAMQNENFHSQIIELNVNGKSESVVVRDVQRHPATEYVTHIDFLRIREDREIQVSAPIRFINEDVCVGVRMGSGTITHNLVEVEISCLPKNLPDAIIVDMADVEVGQAVHLSGLLLPLGVTIPALGFGDDAGRDLSVVSVSLIRVQEEAGEAEETDTPDEDAVDLEAPSDA